MSDSVLDGGATRDEMSVFPGTGPPEHLQMGPLPLPHAAGEPPEAVTERDGLEVTQSDTTQSDVGPMAAAVDASLATAPTRPEDAGTVALVRRYAALIDAATPASKYRPLLRSVRAALDPGDDAAREAYVKIEDALGAHSVASDLGPKLLAALTALGMTLAGRGAAGKGGGPAVGARSTKLDELRARRNRNSAG